MFSKVKSVGDNDDENLENEDQHTYMVMKLDKIEIGNTIICSWILL